VADLALRLKVFIASPSDVLPERDIAHSAIVDLQRDYAREGLLIEPYRWEGRVPPTFRRAQSIANTQLRTAELTIAIFWSTLGTAARGITGSIEELTIAGERVAKGYADDVLLYFKTCTPTSDPTKAEEVRGFKEAIRSIPEVFAVEFASSDEFRERIRRDLRSWLDRWKGAPHVCAYALAKTPGGAPPARITGENRLATLKQRFDPFACSDTGLKLSTSAIAMYQALGPEAAGEAITSPWASNGPSRLLFRETASNRSPIKDLQPLLDASVVVRRNGELFFGHEEWFYFYCAWGLLDAIEAADISSVERRPYINPIHQYLKAICVGSRRRGVSNVLRSWLINADGITEGKPIVRNFAAYVLGMLNAIESQEDLARVSDEDTGLDVRLYCVASLGRMRARVQMPVLIDLFDRTQDETLRLMVAQAVSRMIGIADYPL